MRQQEKPVTTNDNQRSLTRWLESEEYKRMRDILQRQIQEPRLEIDRGCFKKSIKEIFETEKEKRKWKREMKKHYGENWKKYTNTPEILD